MRGLEQIERAARNPAAHACFRQILPGKRSRWFSLAGAINRQCVMPGADAKTVSFSVAIDVSVCSGIDEQLMPIDRNLYAECIRVSVPCAATTMRPSINCESLPQWLGAGQHVNAAVWQGERGCGWFCNAMRIPVGYLIRPK